MSPPNAHQVVERAYALSVVFAFGKKVGALGDPQQLTNLPGDKAQELEKQVEHFVGKLLMLSEKYNFLKCLTLSEQRTVVTPYNKLDLKTLATASWRIECIPVLLWSLGLLNKISNYDAQAATSVVDILQIEKFEDIRSTAKLRSSEEISGAREVAELWHWRCRTKQLIDRGELFPKELNGKSQFKSFDDIVRFTVKASKKENFPPNLQVIDEDFGVRSKAVRDLSEQEFSELFSLAAERHFTLNWLCGFAPGNNWDLTPTET